MVRYCYKGTWVWPAPKQLDGEHHGKWNGAFSVEVETGNGIFLRPKKLPELFASEEEARAAILEHVKRSVDGVPDANTDDPNSV